MFTAEKARKLTNKARENRLSTWEHLQFDIRKQAQQGKNYLYISNERYLNLATTLEVFDYNIVFDNDMGEWKVEW